MAFRGTPHIILLPKVVFYVILFFPAFAQSQVNRDAYEAMKDTVVSEFNQGDYKAIYRLFDTSFSNKISQSQLVTFLKGNQNSGKIVASSFLTEEKGKLSYLLEFELRDMIMDLQLTFDNKISDFGWRSSPPVFLSETPAIKSNNSMKSALDKAVDSAAMEYFRYSKANSLAIGIIKSGKKHIYLYGETEKGNNKLPSLNTLYEIGSITKTFTTTLLAQAVLDKKVSLTDDIRKFLYGNYDNLSYKGIPITLQDLANHTSGLPAMPKDIGEQPRYNPVSPEAHYDSTRFYNALKKISLDTIPGYKFLYSNWGIALLGHILEKVYGHSQAYLVKHFVTEPLGMNRTTYIVKDDSFDVAYPHSENGKRLAITNQGYFSPAGGLCSTVKEMLSYLDAQLKETKASIRLTHVPTANNIGLGWGVRKDSATRHLEHNGSEQGSTANISVFPELNSGCVILVNNKVNLGKLIVRIRGIAKETFYQ
jgi:CubicO group peptidase (beta-lactamase class C family)